MHWDIFCQVIDNHGDLGVCWRLACDLAQRCETVRLWVDDPSSLAWMAPAGHPGVQVGNWAGAANTPVPGDVVIEAFGCEPPASFVTRMAAKVPPPRWINLEYLTAESYAERAHGLPSPVSSGAGAGLTRHFFYPGFTASTGGLQREPELARRQARFDRAGWLHALGVAGGRRIVSLFCYGPPALPRLLQTLSQDDEPTRLLVTAGRAAAAVRAWEEQQTAAVPSGVFGALAITYLPLLTQIDYDHLLWACDFNFVRGEDSIVRALWAGRPFAWQIYPQQDQAHHAKLDAFLDWLQAPPSLRRFHAAWNGITPELSPWAYDEWLPAVLQARARLLAQDDLVTQLLRFVRAGY
jgi:uncharacterized repeat protein (TIGR03837 family)